MNEQAYYLQHSTIGDPGEYIALLDALPDDIPGLCSAVRNIYMHYMSAEDMPVERRAEVDTRMFTGIVKRVQEMDDQPFTVKRPREQKFIGCCRDAALLFTTMARHKGIPARLRVGFAAYINLGKKGFHVDHVVSEIWDVAQERWRLVDPEQSEALIKENNIQFDVTDIPRDQFIVGGQAWQACRSGEADPSAFGVHPEENFVRGWWFIRNRTIVDLAALNKIELLLWDTWGWMEHDAVLTAEDEALMDQVAEITQHGTLAQRQAIYQNPIFKAPRIVMNYSPVQAWQQVEVPNE